MRLSVSVACVCSVNKTFYLLLLYYIYMLKSRKWSRVAPKRVGERSALLAKCGRRCFLGSAKSFPICARLVSGSRSSARSSARSTACKIDRRGVQAAYIRAREWASITARKKGSSAKAARSHRRYTAIARKARKILDA